MLEQVSSCYWTPPVNIASVQSRNIIGPDLVYAQHLHKICRVGCSVILLVASDKHSVLALHMILGPDFQKILGQT